MPFAPLSQRVNLERRPAGLQERPVLQQFRMVDFGPCFDEALLRARKAAADAFDRVQSERCDYILIRGMEMRPVVRCTDLQEHSNYDSEESGNLRHPFTCLLNVILTG